MLRRLIPYAMACCMIFGFSKIMSLLNNDTSLIEALTIHADNTATTDTNKTQTTSENMTASNNKQINKVDIVKTDGEVLGSFFNVDTSQIQNIAACQKLHDLNFSNDEIEILRSLRQRREEIENKSKDLALMESALKSIQHDIEAKLLRLEKINTLMEERELEGGTSNTDKISKLVKIYEGMKPKDAANIFDDLQTSILIEVAQKMKENKLAAIVAEMQPQKARDLTTALVTNRSSMDFD